MNSISLNRATLGLPPALTRHAGLAAVLVLICLYLSVRSEVFATTPNLVNVLRQVAVMAVLAAGLTVLMAAGGLDFSLGSQVAVVVAVVARLLESGTHVVIASICGVLLGATFGLVNGLVVTVFKVAPFVTTLATATVLDGAALIAMKGQSVSAGGALTDLGTGELLGIPYLLLIAVLVIGGAAATLRWTRFGRDALAIGGNAVAARLGGIPVLRHTVMLYVANGMLAGLAGIMLLSRLGAASPGTAGLHLELTVVAAVVIGGTALHGGNATVAGTVLGVLLLGIVANGINLLQIDSFYQSVAVGVVLLVAAVVNQLRHRGPH
ncbi:ABC transporter permease [Nocardioides carbamazepini]|uniref:ABC transporter permease n=1 Tax=Nocardioides carbamazepini TaxID=2854259 RepID=UPI002149F5F7|nr:ABC transporter permease [Nocardioides carbamazepini]MCR1782703.1 ABC transporter permease [Nocardioides carbamazepini]